MYPIRFTFRFFPFCTITLATCGAYAAASPPGFDGLDVAQVCPAAGPVSRAVLARSILKSHSISIDMIDWNNTGIGTEQYVHAVSRVLCERTPLTDAQQKLCFGEGKSPPGGGKPPSGDSIAQGALVFDLNSTLGPLVPAAGPHKDFTIELGKATLEFHALPVAQSDEQIRTRTAPNAPAVEKVFGTDPKYFDITCKLKDSTAAPGNKSAGKGNSPSKNGAVQSPGAVGSTSLVSKAAFDAFTDHFRLRGKPEDLGIGRDSDAFAGASSATLSTVNDVAAQKNTFDAHMTLGYYATPLDFSGATLESVPFLQYDRSYVDGGKAPPNSSNVNNIGLGIQERFTFPVAGVYGSLFFQPEFIASLRSGAQLVKVRFAYEADPLIPFIGFAAPTVIPSLWATAYARVALNAYEVTKSANDNSLTANSNFVQGGTELGFTLFVNDDSSPFMGLSVPVSYTSLYGFSGPYKSVELFQAAINYTFPKTKYVTVGLSYMSGRNLETFEAQKVYKASLGLKY
jgi:hypothetical protein